MKRITVLFLIFFGLYAAGCGFLGISNSQTGEEQITAEKIKQNISFLASDSLKGRNTPSAELDVAANYIANEFASSGIKPVNGSYFQKVTMGMITLGPDNQLVLNPGKEQISFKLKDDFTPFEMTANKEASGQVVFAGYGIDAPEYKYNDYENLDVKGKIVFVLRHEPGENDTSSIFDGNKSTKYSDVNEKVKIAVQHGAAGVLVAQDPLNHTLLTPRGFPWPSLSKFIPKDAVPLSLMLDEKDKVPVVQVGEKVIDKFFGSVDKLKEIQSEIDKNLKPKSFLIEGSEISLKTSTEIKDMSSNNVVGFLEGSDPVLKKELLVIGGHYDHVGMKLQHNKGEDYIYNGADDNASGTCGVMAVASAFGSLKEKPKRSILFIAFCGEEKGLFGSRYYAENPLFPLENTVAMLNLDMIGRNNIDSITVIGYAKSPELVQETLDANKEIGFKINYLNERINGGSDHQSFLNKKIPSLFYHSGLHPDYHKVSDEVRLINFDKIAKTSRLVFKTALQIGNENRRYKFISN